MSLVSKNIFWLTLSRVAALALLFFAYARLLRYLGPSSYGQYQFILSYVLLFSTVVDFGIQQFITKKISEQPQETKKYFHSFLAFEVLVSVLLYGVLITVAKLNHYDNLVFFGIAIAGLGMVANALTYPFLAVLTAAQDLRKVAFINFLNSLVNAAFIFLAIYFHRSVIFLSFIQLTFGLLDVSLYRYYLKEHLPKPQLAKVFSDFDFSIIKHIVVSAWPFVLLVGFSAIYNRIDIVLVSKMLGYEQTGYYGAAYKIFDLLGFFPSVVSHTLFPHFASLMAKNEVAAVKENVEKYLRLMVATALPIAVGGMLLSGQLIVLLAGREFAPASEVLSILIWAPAILFIYIPVNSLVISQLTKKAMFVTGANVLVNIAGNILLLPVYGVKAAAAMTVLSESIQGIFYFYFVSKNITKFSFASIAVKPLAAAAVMGLVLREYKTENLALNLVLGGLTYGVSLLALRFFKKEDVQFVKSMLGGGHEN